MEWRNFRVALDIAAKKNLTYRVLQKCLCLLMLLQALPVVAQTAPDNDNANNRINLGSVATYTVTTSNIGAGTQNQEDTRNGLLGSTIWWQWTCPVSAWARIDTQGSEIDTVIKVNAGGNLNSAMLGYNDDVDAQQITSSLSFMATANTTYYLQIGGYQGEQGTIQLNITTGTGATPSHWPTAMTYTPSSINATNADASLSVAIALGGSAGIVGTADLQFLRPNETVLSPVLVGSRSYTSGGVGPSLACDIPRYSAAGNWHPLISLQPQAGSVLRFGGTLSGRPYLLSSAMLPSLTVINTGTSDAVAPILQTFSISTTQVDVNQAPANVTLSASISDVTSGLQRVEVWLYHPTNPAFNRLLPVSLTSGDPNNGIWSGQAVIPLEYPTEVYSVNIIVTDNALNQAVYGAYSALETPGGDVFLSISGGGAYWQWAYERIGQDNPLVNLSDDANGDGISNLLCYAFGLEPLALSPPTTLPRVGREDGAPVRLSITYRRNTSPDSGLTYFPEFSDTLSSWQASSQDPTLISETGTWQEWKIVDDRDASTAPNRFGRVRVIYSDSSL